MDKFEIGIVTSNGIWFEGKIYSCSLALRQQWYKHAEYIGGWPVSVRRLENDRVEVILQDSTTVVCIRVDHIPVDQVTLNSYYVEFQRLAALRKQLQAEKDTDTGGNLHSDKPTNN
ncbi:hypothetical protein FHS18_003844 [Paenibacillus phyllosphaerae]|uniref:Uncharacterized protein n=1 Tax=Paenibacillus phyllosphaerae TaxID=274593 RepID=A0A7W5FNX4_9BACL|nr:hypothetical protein [Paenibacillus phyllosphaerae]